MNYLAHIFLARQNGDTMLGGILGDFVTPAEGRRFPWEIAREIELHRYIDSYTDQHPVVRDAKRRFRPHTRRFAGPLLDLFFDHALSAYWNRYSETPLHDFIDRFYGAIRHRWDILPQRFRRRATPMIEQNWLAAYADFDGVAMAANGLAQRLSRGGDRLIEGLDDMRRDHDALLTDFQQFFPSLESFADERRDALDASRREPSVSQESGR